jgi:hypothetical protein
MMASDGRLEWLYGVEINRTTLLLADVVSHFAEIVYGAI